MGENTDGHTFSIPRFPSARLRKSHIIAHLASYERVVVDVLNTFLGSTPTAYSMRWINQPAEFNKAEVEARKYHTAQHVEDEYQDLQVQATSLLAQIPEETIPKTGTMPWYKQDCCLV